MRSLLYLYRRTFRNLLVKALKRPLTYIYAFFVIGYVLLMLFSIGGMVGDFGIDTKENFAVILSILVFFLIPGNMISYTKRKGLLFRPSDVHFVFTAPLGPKAILLGTAIKSFLTTFLLGLLMTLLGIFFFHVPVLNMILYFLLFSIGENIMEASMVVICYGNETIPKKVMDALVYVMYAIMAAFVLIAVYMLVTREANFSVISEYLSMPVIQMLPIIGWCIAFARLLILGPTTLNLIGTGLFVLATIVLGIYARKMKCTGEYFEDAMSFSEDYEVRRAKARKGENTFGLKSKKFKAAKVTYKGKYGKAIFYRQLLEYKKNRFFIFGWQTLLSAGAGIAIAVVSVLNNFSEEFGTGKVFIIPAVIAYLLFIFSGYATKWAKELENPYTYLIPDTSFRKMWNATKMEHIRSLIDGVFITLPGAIVLGLRPVATVLTVLIYACLCANRLYFNMLAEAILGNLLGATARSILKVLLQGIVISISVVAALAAGMLLGVELGFFVMILVTSLLTLGGAFGAATIFDRMEALS